MVDLLTVAVQPEEILSAAPTSLVVVVVQIAAPIPVMGVMLPQVGLDLAVVE